MSNEIRASAPIIGADSAARTITARLMVWGSIGNTSHGPTRFTPGSIEVPADPKRVKFLREHDRDQILGYARQIIADDIGLIGVFHLPPGDPTRDRALLEASDGIRDAVSVGVMLTDASTGDDGITDVTSSRLQEVSQVAFPAFDTATVLTVTANRKDHPIMDPVATTAPPASTEPPAPVIDGEITRLIASVEALTAAIGAGGQTINADAPAPAGAGGSGSADAPRGLTASQFFAAAAATARGEMSEAELTAALSDIVPTADNVAGLNSPTYLQELWGENPVLRPMFDFFGASPIGFRNKLVVWEWVTKPKVAPYAGGKAAVPSNGPIKTQPREVTPFRVAGAHDIDRIFFDLGDEMFQREYWAAMTESYKVESEALAEAEIVGDFEDRSAITEAYTSTALDAVIGAVVDLAKIGRRIDFVAIAPDLVEQLFGITMMDAPAFFNGNFQLNQGGNGQLGNVNWMVWPTLAEGRIFTGAKEAIKLWENPVPIRAQVVNIANGGIDCGLFGYGAAAIKNRTAVKLIDTIEPVEEPPAGA